LDPWITQVQLAISLRMVSNYESRISPNLLYNENIIVSRTFRRIGRFMYMLS
jgi:hypothetical protein